MKTLNLIIKQKFFDEIIAGAKKEEYRICDSAFLLNKYCNWYADGKSYDKLKDIPLDAKEWYPKIKDFDAIQFYVGYNKDRASALVELKGHEVQGVVDDEYYADLSDEEYNKLANSEEDVKCLTFEYKVPGIDEPFNFNVCRFTFHLGKIIEKHNC